jgi:hypothetical protein
MQLHDAVDKLNREVDIFNQMFSKAHYEETHLGLVLDQAKRVRRTSTLLVRALAEDRDNRNATA